MMLLPSRGLQQADHLALEYAHAPARDPRNRPYITSNKRARRDGGAVLDVGDALGLVAVWRCKKADAHGGKRHRRLFPDHRPDVGKVPVKLGRENIDPCASGDAAGCSRVRFSASCLISTTAPCVEAPRRSPSSSFRHSLVAALA